MIMHLFASFFFVVAFISSVEAQATLPNLTLPWGTWQATKYDKKGDFFTFRNVRFGQAPVGSQRFKAPSYPASIPDNQTRQDSSYGPSCIQVDATRNCTPGGQGDNLGALPLPGGKESEDCLFLDIYVPRSAALSPSGSKVPVVVWFYGGAYVYGSKDILGPDVPFYNGTGPLLSAKESNKKLIFITGNYRLGAFGWLAGTEMEKRGLPNAGLYDQRLVLQWVQDFVHLVGGDKNQVSAWGESAGAGSIVHHLISNGGQQDPLFKKAIIQSPAFEWQWDRTGTMNYVFKRFSMFSKCSEYNMSCLQAATTLDLARANQKLFEETTPCTGLFPVGPSLDGGLIQQLPAVAFSKGNYWKSLDSLIVSHVADESHSFIPSFVKKPSDFTTFVNWFMPEPELAPARAAIEKQYPAQGPPYGGNPRKRVGALIRDSTFTCNTRQLYDAYKGRSVGLYMMQYDLLASQDLAVHASDLVPTFWNSEMNTTKLFIDVVGLSKAKAELAGAFFDHTGFPQGFQSYFTSHAITGNPNTYRRSGIAEWQNASDNGNEIVNAMETALFPFFNGKTKDTINTRTACDFWKKIAFEMSNISLALTMQQHPLTVQMEEAF